MPGLPHRASSEPLSKATVRTGAVASFGRWSCTKPSFIFRRRQYCPKLNGPSADPFLGPFLLLCCIGLTARGTCAVRPMSTSRNHTLLWPLGVVRRWARDQQRRSCLCPPETSLPRLGPLFHFLSWKGRSWPLSGTSSRVVNSRALTSSTWGVSDTSPTGSPAQSRSAFQRLVESPLSLRLAKCGESSTCLPPTARGHLALFHEWGKPRQSIIRLDTASLRKTNYEHSTINVGMRSVARCINVSGLRWSMFAGDHPSTGPDRC